MKVCPTCYGRGQVTGEQAADVFPGQLMVVYTRIARAARAVEAKLAQEAREANCDIVNDEHEQLRSALHNLDSTSAIPEKK